MRETDAELVARMRLGDGRATGRLAERYLRGCRAVALAILGDEPRAEDVCQDAFVYAIQRIDDCRKPESFGAWLMQIVRNRARNAARELGGTKVVCAVGTGPDDVRDLARFPTTDPYGTLERVGAFFRRGAWRPQAVGVASFGPLDPDPTSPSYGFITRTPKPGWSNAEVLPRIAKALDAPVTFDTDVNAAALGEHRWGAARDVSTFVYITVGTGIGGGALVHGRRLHGLLHPEMGHLLLPRVPGDTFPGVCPFHGDCLEGLASGVAIRKRWGCAGEDLPAGHFAWELEARYLALAVVNLTLTLSPERIILGGGVMQNRFLLPAIRREVRERLNGYPNSSTLLDGIDDYLVAPGLGDRAGVLGAIAMAQELPARS